MTEPTFRRCRGEDGVTLVELLTAMGVSALVLAVVAGAVIQALATQRRQSSQVSALNDAKIAFERITRDIRGADPLQVTALDRVTLASRLADTTVRAVTYERVGTTLVATDSTVGVPRTLLAGMVPDRPVFLFHLLDGSTAEQAPDPGAVRSVTVRLHVKPAGGGPDVNLENRVVVRNAGLLR